MRRDVGRQGDALRVVDPSARGVFVQVAMDGRLPVVKGGVGMVAAPVLPQREGEGVDVVVSDVLKGGVDGSELEGATVIREETVRLVRGGVFTHRDAVVHRHPGRLLDVQLEQHRRGGRGAGAGAKAGEENEAAGLGDPLEVGVGE